MMRPVFRALAVVLVSSFVLVAPAAGALLAGDPGDPGGPVTTDPNGGGGEKDTGRDPAKS